MGNYHARCGAGEKPEVATLEAYLSLLALPDGFTSLLSTMRSRNISSIIIIQNMAQIKTLFDKSWEIIPGNCDTLIFLGGNEVDTHKYISELMGKQTIDKRSSSESKGRQGSFSNSFDVLGRELMLPDEVRKIDGSKCLVFIRGFDPIMDDKIHTNFLPFWQEVNEIEKTYSFDARLERAKKRAHHDSFRLYTDNDLKGIEADQRKEEEEYRTLCQLAELEGTSKPAPPNRKIIEVSFEELLASYHKMKETEAQFDEELLQWSMEDTRQTEYQEPENKNEQILNSETADIAFTAVLEENGFDMEQILILAALKPVMSASRVVELFTPDTIPEIVELLVEDILTENTL